MKKVFLSFVLFTAALLVCCTEDEVAMFGDVYGTVTNSKTGEPVRNAQVVLAPSGASTISGSDGHFEFTSLEAGQYSISISSDGYESNSRQITIVPGQRISCDIHLTPRATTPEQPDEPDQPNEPDKPNEENPDDSGDSGNTTPSTGSLYTDPTVLDFGTDETQMYYTLYNVPDWTSGGGSMPVGFSRSLLSMTKNEDGNHTYKYRVDLDRELVTSVINGPMTHWFNSESNSVSLTVKATPSTVDYTKGKISVSPEVLNFTGDDDRVMSIEVTNTGSSFLKWEITYDKDLVKVDNRGDGAITWNLKAGSTVSYDVALNNNNAIDTYITLTNKYDTSDVHKIHVTNGNQDSSELTGNKIYYTSTDGQAITLNKKDGFGANIASHVYEDGQGVITFHGNVSAIGESAFSSCVTLESITLPETVTKIGNNAFRYCSALTGINIPASVTGIGHSVFEGCTNLETFSGNFTLADSRCLVVNGEMVAFAPYGLTSYAIPEGITKVGYYVFSNCTQLTEITIPGSVTAIDSGAFWACTSLTSITIPESVEVMGEAVFGGCTNLSAFNGQFATEDKLGLVANGVFVSAAHKAVTSDAYTIPVGVNTIGGYAFYGSAALANVTIPESVMHINLGAFYGCEALTEVHCQPVDPPTFGQQALDGAPDELKIYVRASSVDAYKIADGWNAYADKIVAEPSSEDSGDEGTGEEEEDTNINTTALYASPAKLDFGTEETQLYYTVHNVPTNYGGSGSWGPGDIVRHTFLSKTENAIGKHDYLYRMDLNRDMVSGEFSAEIGHSFGDESTSLIVKATPSTINYSAGKISVSPTELYFEGKREEVLYFDITNTGSSHLKYDITYDSDYIHIDDNGSSTITMNVKAGTTFKQKVTLKVNNVVDTYITLTNKYNSADTHKIHVVAGVAVSTIYYTSTDGNIVTPNTEAFSTKIASNTYENGQGEITLVGDITSIGNDAFMNCTTLASIAIPDNITSIGQRAFYSCNHLTSIDLPSGITSIGDNAFRHCSALTSFDIPSGVTTIELSTFQNCTALESVTIPSGVTAIKAGAFAGCSALTSIEIPSGVTTIGGMAFQGCTNLTAIAIPTGVTKIEASTFASSGLTSITIPSGVTAIGEKAFDSCSNLAEVQCLPTTPPTLGASAFNGVAEGCKINIPSGTYSAYVATEGWSDYAALIVNEAANGLIEVANPELDFGLETPLSTFTITNIGTSKLEWTITDIPEYMTIEGKTPTATGSLDVGASIDVNVAIDRATMPDEVDVNLTLANVHNAEDTHTIHIIASRDYTKGLIEVSPTGINFGLNDTKATLTISNVGTDALKWAIDEIPEYLTVGGVVTSTSGTMGSGASVNLDIVLDRKTMPEDIDINLTVKNLHNENDTHTVRITGINEIAKNKIYYTTTNDQVTDIFETSVFGADIVSNEYVNGLGVITFSGDITSIGDRAFNGCTTLESIIIPEGVTSIGNKAFKNCSGLTSVQIPSTVTTIGDEAFYECSVLTSAKLPAGLTSLGGHAFFRCVELLSTNIPSGITEIKEHTFYDCYKLNNITLPEGLTTIGSWAFGYNWELTSINIPSTVTFIGGNAFTLNGSYISKLSEVHITDLSAWCNITFENAESNPVNNRHWDSNLGREVSPKFYVNNAQVTNLVIPYDVTVIKPFAFFSFLHIKTITIHDNVTEIGNNAFEHCYDVTTVTIGSGVQSIGWFAFANMSNLKTVYCRATTPPNGSGNPSIDGANEKIYVPTASVTAYRSANDWSNYTDYIWEHTF